MAEVKPRSSCGGADEVVVVEEASCSGADGSTSPESVPPSIAAESPSFFTWMWIRILTACSGVWGTRGGGWLGPRASALASGAQQQTQEDSESEVLSRIAASKSTWSEVPGRNIQQSVPVLSPNHLSDWEELKGSNPRFFRDYPDLEIGRLIAEGGQAQIFEAKMPNRYWGDLRTLIDLKVEENIHSREFDLLSRNGRESPPFSFQKSVWIMLQIARGMQKLHVEGVLHRDLKAANVLIIIPHFDTLLCDAVDYECAMFVQGMGFWRAPEVLKELQKKEEDQNDEIWTDDGIWTNNEIWTKKVDVYSFGMTCYEILTGQIPFDGYTKSKWGDVIKGERPSLPNYIFYEVRELIEACWQVDPSQRPSFDYIVGVLDSLRRKDYSWN